MNHRRLSIGGPLPVNELKLQRISRPWESHLSGENEAKVMSDGIALFLSSLSPLSKVTPRAAVKSVISVARQVVSGFRGIYGIIATHNVRRESLKI